MTITYHSYDAATGQVIFRILNGRLSPTLECIDARIVNFSSGESYSSGYSNAPFASSTSPVPFTSRLEPELGAYLKYVLRGTPSNVRVRATFEVYTGENRTGSHVTKIVDSRHRVAAVLLPQRQPLIDRLIPQLRCRHRQVIFRI